MRQHFRCGRTNLVLGKGMERWSSPAAFVGYLVAGFWGSLASAVGIILPSFVLVLVAAALLARHRASPTSKAS